MVDSSCAYSSVTRLSESRVSRLRYRHGWYDCTMNRSNERPLDLELPLNGGRITQGVVRIGETVRRPANLSSPFVASLLDHLEHTEYSGAPHYFGQDDKGRDIFSFIPGKSRLSSDVLRTIRLPRQVGL